MVGKTKTNPKSKPKTKPAATKKPATTKVAKKAPEPTKTWKKVLLAVLCAFIPLAVGGLSTLLTGDAMSKFDQFAKPPLAPPAWLFPVAWSIIYVLMGLALYFIIAKKPKNKQEMSDRKIAVTIFFIQLAFNFAWSPIFFLSGDFFFALMWLAIMWIMIIVLMFWARRRSMTAVWLLLPYALWCVFAMYLNFGILLLN